MARRFRPRVDNVVVRGASTGVSSMGLPFSSRGLFHERASLATAIVALGAISACNSRSPTEDQTTELAPFALSASSIPASPTNRFADDQGAAALGQRLFFDRRMSSDGTVACVSCHDPTHGFSDVHPRSVGVGGLTGSRHT